MSDNEEIDQPFSIEKAKTGRAACKKCKEKCITGELRMSRMLANPFGSGKMHHWYHVDCLLASFKTQRATTRAIQTVDDILGWATLGDLDREALLEKLQTVDSFRNSNADSKDHPVGAVSAVAEPNFRPDSDDNLFREFRRICERLAGESSYLGKTAILHKFFLKGSNGQRFEGKLYVWTKLLLPNAEKRIYNLQSRQLIKLFARIFGADPAEMMADLEQGDVSETIRTFFERCKRAGKPTAATVSTLTLDAVDECLDKLSMLSKEDEQVDFFRALCKQCTPDDLKMIIRFIKHDLRINSGAKHVLAAFSADAYTVYQSSRDLRAVVARFGGSIATNRIDEVEGRKAKADGGIQLMSPISPMLAEACKSVERAIEKCPDGMYSEIKYDGERIQLHKRGSEFRFFSRNLKPVPDHKTKRCEEFIPQAFPGASDLILDSEILMVDTTTGEQLPFGTLGKHKKTAFDTAEVCLFVFDCIYYNGEDMTKKPLKERRKILEQHITPIRNHVQLSEYHLIRKPRELSVMIAKVLQMGLEGLVLKNVNGIYEPGKRHWLKVKKDYLFDGQMADAADLVVLGASFGTGKKGGMLSVYLMGSWDERTRRWCTVTKVHTGFDDRTMERVHKHLTARTIRSDPDAPPSWLNCKRALIPDMIARDPHAMPVWEITGAEFTKSDHHTADGISIRFPRITRQRDDKTTKEATNVQELHRLYEASKECTNLQLLTNGLTAEDDDAIHIETKIQHGPRTSPQSAVAVKRRSAEVDAAVKDEEVDDDGGRATMTGKKRAKLQAVKAEPVVEQSSNRKEEEAPSSSRDEKPTSGDTSATRRRATGSHDTKAGVSGRPARGAKRQQQPIQYKYEDSSDDDNNNDDENVRRTDVDDDAGAVAIASRIVKETMVNIPDMFAATAAAAAAKSDARATKRAGGAGGGGVAGASQLVDRKIVSDSDNAATTTTPVVVVVGDVPEGTTSAAAASLKRENNSGPSHVGRTARNSAINIFEGVVLCVPAAGGGEGDVRECVKEELRYFQLWGGRIVVVPLSDGGVDDAPMDCTHALHRHATMRCDDWTVLRRRYAPHCRHVQLAWLVDAVRLKARVSAEAYPVTLVI